MDLLTRVGVGGWAGVTEGVGRGAGEQAGALVMAALGVVVVVGAI